MNLRNLLTVHGAPANMRRNLSAPLKRSGVPLTDIFIAVAVAALALGFRESVVLNTVNVLLLSLSIMTVALRYAPHTIVATGGLRHQCLWCVAVLAASILMAVLCNQAVPQNCRLHIIPIGYIVVGAGVVAADQVSFSTDIYSNLDCVAMELTMSFNYAMVWAISRQVASVSDVSDSTRLSYVAAVTILLRPAASMWRPLTFLLWQTYRALTWYMVSDSYER